MSLKHLTLCAIATGAFAVAAGCDDKPSTPTPAAAPADTTAAPAAGSPAMSGQLQKARDQANATAADMQAKAADTGAQADAAAKDAGTKAQAAGDTLVAQAQKLYDDARAAINKADFNGAQKYVDQLTALRDKLPPEWQTKVDELSKMLADGKSKLGGMNLPSMPK